MPPPRLPTTWRVTARGDKARVGEWDGNEFQFVHVKKWGSDNFGGCERSGGWPRSRVAGKKGVRQYFPLRNSKPLLLLVKLVSNTGNFWSPARYGHTKVVSRALCIPLA